MLRGLKTNHIELKKALEGMNEMELSAERLKAIQKFLPLPEEIQALDAYEEDRSLLGPAEKYISAVQLFLFCLKK